MNSLLIAAALPVAYVAGYYALFLRAPAALSRTAPAVVAYAERKFPKHKGVEAVQMLVVTRLGSVAGIVGIGSIIASIIAR